MKRLKKYHIILVFLFSFSGYGQDALLNCSHDFEISFGISAFPGLNDVMDLQKHDNDNLNLHLNVKRKLFENFFVSLGLFNYKLKNNSHSPSHLNHITSTTHYRSMGFRIGIEQHLESDFFGVFHGPSYIYASDFDRYKTTFKLYDSRSDQSTKYKGIGYLLGFSLRFADNTHLAFSVEPSFFKVDFKDRYQGPADDYTNRFTNRYFTMNNNIMVTLMGRF